MTKKLALLLALAPLAGCAELHQKEGRFAATGASFNILFLQIPKDPMESAAAKVPAGATVTNVNGSPNDWRFVLGFFQRLLGVGWAQIGGTSL